MYKNLDLLGEMRVNPYALQLIIKISLKFAVMAQEVQLLYGQIQEG